jgi:hypothetical protein
MPLVSPEAPTVTLLATYGVIAHMNGELNGWTGALEAYFYENLETFGIEIKSENARNVVVDMAAQVARSRIVVISVHQGLPLSPELLEE